MDSLRKTDFNRADTDRFLEDSAPMCLPAFDLPPGYTMRRSLDGRQYRVIHGGLTVHYVALSEKAHNVPGITNAMTMAAWRTTSYGHDESLSGYATALVASLTERYSLFMREPKLNRFEQYRLSDAIADPDQRVLLWDGERLTEVSGERELSELVWSDANPHQLIIMGKEENPMRDDMFKELVESMQEAVAIRRGEVEPARVTTMKRTRNHDEATVEMLRKDPAFALDYLDAVIAGISEPHGEEVIKIAVGHINEAFGCIKTESEHTATLEKIEHMLMHDEDNPLLDVLCLHITAYEIQLPEIIEWHKRLEEPTKIHVEFEGKAYTAHITYDPTLAMHRGEFVGLVGGADFYAVRFEDLQKEAETSLRVFLEGCEQHGIEPFKGE